MRTCVGWGEWVGGWRIKAGRCNTGFFYKTHATPHNREDAGAPCWFPGTLRINTKPRTHGHDMSITGAKRGARWGGGGRGPSPPQPRTGLGEGVWTQLVVAEDVGLGREHVHGRRHDADLWDTTRPAQLLITKVRWGKLCSRAGAREWGGEEGRHTGQAQCVHRGAGRGQGRGQGARANGEWGGGKGGEQSARG